MNLVGALSEIDSIRKKIINDTLTFSQAVSRHSEDDDTKNTGGMIINRATSTSSIEIDQLDKDLFAVIDKMNVGDISQPVLFTVKDGNEAYRIVLLKSQSKPHKANLKDDYSKIKSAALNEKQMEQMNIWLKKKIDKTYIFIDDSYRRCEIMENWVTDKGTTGM